MNIFIKRKRQLPLLRFFACRLFVTFTSLTLEVRSQVGQSDHVAEQRLRHVTIVSVEKATSPARSRYSAGSKGTKKTKQNIRADERGLCEGNGPASVQSVPDAYSL